MLSMSHRAPGYRLNSHVPPTFSAISSTLARTPISRSRCSAYRPEKPAPMTITSKRAELGMVTSRHLTFPDTVTITVSGSGWRDYEIYRDLPCRYGQSFFATLVIVGG